jgi:hypothetical protein
MRLKPSLQRKTKKKKKKNKNITLTLTLKHGPSMSKYLLNLKSTK